jgi:hypothetical protein
MTLRIGCTPNRSDPQGGDKGRLEGRIGKDRCVYPAESQYRFDSIEVDQRNQGISDVGLSLASSSFATWLIRVLRHRSVAALRRRNISGLCARDEQADLPLRSVRFRTSLFCESEGWPRDAHLRVREVEADGGVGRQLESNRPDRPV